MGESIDCEREAKTAVALQAAVFATPNTLRADSFEPLRPALRWHAHGRGDRPVLLPFKATGDELVCWYACARADAMVRALAHEMGAFLGPSYIEVASPDRTPDVADTHMMPLIARAGWRGIRFSAQTVQAERTVLQQWERYWRLLERRPMAASHIPQTFDQARAAFDRALAAGNESGAHSALAVLRERFGLSAENRLYLDIRRAAALGKWDEIARHRLLHTVVHLRLPPETYGDVMEAIYEAEVAPFERARRLEDLLNQFSKTMAETAKPLFRTRRASKRPTVLKAFVLFELIQSDPCAQACIGMLDNLPIGAFGDLDAAVRTHIAHLGTTPDPGAAYQAIAREQFDRAYDLIWPLPDDAQVLLNLVLCARESEDSTKAQAVLTRLQNASARIREAVEQGAPVRLQRLRSLVTNQPAKARETFAEQVAQRSGESDDDYVERWRELARDAQPDAILLDSRVPLAATECLTRLVVDQPSVFERLHPLWHELFVDRLLPNRRLIPIYSALLETLRVRGDFSDTDRALLRQTLSALVMAGPDQATYRSAVDEVHEVFKAIRSPHVMVWALEVCDLLATAPTRDPEARMRLLLSVQQAGIEYAARLAPVARALLRLLLSEAGIEVAQVLVERSEGEGGMTDVSADGRLVALYSLDESATKRATHLLGEAFPRLRVDSNADPVCTPRLKSLAQRADVFVFAWKSSKHAAFDCVKAAVRTKEALIMARGTGATSLVDAVLDGLRLG